jgi:hypothetical protein
MIKDKPVRIIQWAFIGVEKFLLRHFSKVSFYDIPEVDKNRATLLLMNHFSFNDGPILHRLSRKILKKQFKVMVVEEQLKAFSILKYVGCFSVNKTSRTVIESLNYAASKLDNPENMLGIFPQGEVYSSHLNRVHFESGLERVLKKNKKPIQIIFAVALLDYLDNFRPHARVYLKEYTGLNDLEQMEKSYNEFYCASKRKQQALHRPPSRVID